ncbi:MAG: galactose-1-phosphate uridylyltransferase [bacterium]|nr:galactose-1-phosphate uridylyltransferase [bacterium]
MPELRKDPVIGRWVIISAERGKRPMDFPHKTEKLRGGFCPFCPGHEKKTPPEVLSYPAIPGDSTSEWSVRVVPNKFPALIIEGDLQRKGIGLYDMMTGIGAHEVVIDTPDHGKSLADYDESHISNVLEAYQSRLRDLSHDKRFRYILIFKNQGEEAGASLEHSHTQLIATPIIPKRVIEELEGAASHFEIKERCIYCDIIDQERFDGRRLIFENDDFVAISPFAARFPFETWILPKRHESHFHKMEPAQRLQLASLLKVILRKLNLALDNPAYNFVIHTAPINDRKDWYFHWHIELMPKLTQVAGFEWGSGFYINPTPPEEAAGYLRNLKLD